MWDKTGRMAPSMGRLVFHEEQNRWISAGSFASRTCLCDQRGPGCGYGAGEEVDCCLVPALLREVALTHQRVSFNEGR